MRRNFLTRLIVCLIPTLLAAAVVGWAFQRESGGGIGFRRGIDLAGGTILVYEVNLERTLKGRGVTLAPTTTDDAGRHLEGLTNEEIKRLAENIKNRIDPGDLKNVIVRPSGTTRIEIIIPFSANAKKSGNAEAKDNNSDSVQEVKEKIRQVGILEFRIVANGVDDREGITDAQALLDRAKTDAKFRSDLEELAKRGLPPPAPTGSYTVTVNGEPQADTTYGWVALGREERRTYGLSNMHAAGLAPEATDEERRQAFNYRTFLNTRQEDAGALAKAGRVVVYNPLSPLKESDFASPAQLFFTREFTKDKPTPTEAEKQVEYFLLTRISPIDALRVDREMGMTAKSGTAKGNPAIDFEFNAAGGTRFSKISQRNRVDTPNKIRRQLAIIMDEEIISAPNLNEPIGSHGQITGNFDQGTVNRIVYILRSGALNAELKPDPVSENSVGPTLGRDTIRKGLAAVAVSFAAVLAFMVVYYRFAGVVACVALFVNLLLTVGFMVAVSAAFTLPGLAGIVLMLGMAVDANVLIYERIREEREKGANLVTAIRLGYDRAFSTIIDTHLTSIFTCMVLYAFGNESLKGFSISLTVGLLISLFTALYLTRLMFDYWLSRRWLSQLRMMRLFARPTFNFMAIRNAMFALTATLTVLGLALFVFRGSSVFNVDFTRGTAYGGRLAEGEERALNDVDGKKGFLTLLSESAQRDRLKVKDAVWLKRDIETGEETRRSGADYVYRVAYEDGTQAVVTFANKPDGDDEAAQKADVIERASRLPGASVEQVYVEADSFPNGKSRSFTVRTTEKEPDLVQTTLDRLLRDEPAAPLLLASTKVTALKVTGPVAEVTLDRPASPRHFASFLERELQVATRWPAVGATGLEAVGIPSADAGAAADEARTGQFTRFRISVAANSEFRALKEATDANKPVAGDPRAAADQAAFTQALDKAKAAFEARPLPDRLETFDPALAADTRNKAFYAIGASWLAVLAFLWFRFGNWTFGLAAVVCLIHDLCFTLGAIALCHYLYDSPVGGLLLLHDFKIDLATIAALLTLVGFSVNDTIVVFDRIREVRGKSPVLTAQMINDSVNQTLSRTVLASLTVFLVVGVLYLFGGEGVHLFSFVMVVGVLVGTYSSIYIASPLLLMFGEGTPKVDPRFADRRPAAAVGAAGGV